MPQTIVTFPKNEKDSFSIDLHSNITFSELSSIWLAQKKMEIKDSTFILYENIICTYILPEFNEMKFAEITSISLRPAKKPMFSGLFCTPKIS